MINRTTYLLVSLLLSFNSFSGGEGEGVVLPRMSCRTEFVNTLICHSFKSKIRVSGIEKVPDRIVDQSWAVEGETFSNDNSFKKEFNPGVFEIELSVKTARGKVGKKRIKFKFNDSLVKISTKGNRSKYNTSENIRFEIKKGTIGKVYGKYIEGNDPKKGVSVTFTDSKVEDVVGIAKLVSISKNHIEIEAKGVEGADTMWVIGVDSLGRRINVKFEVEVTKKK